MAVDEPHTNPAHTGLVFPIVPSLSWNRARLCSFGLMDRVKALVLNPTHDRSEAVWVASRANGVELQTNVQVVTRKYVIVPTPASVSSATARAMASAYVNLQAVCA
jgi:hypothetical protein